jgi:peptide/nickel transport system ATP-binding protein
MVSQHHSPLTTPGGLLEPAVNAAAAVLDVRDLVVEFGRVRAVAGVSFAVPAGETLGLVGESGCGKSSTARAVLQAPRPAAGSVRFRGTELTTLPARQLRRLRPQLQLIFQDPVSALNPRRTAIDLVAEPLDIWRSGVRRQRRERAAEALDAVGLDPSAVGARRPHELSGGQCQRVAIARALVIRPALLICDEPVSSLDVSVQAQILNLLHDAKARFGLTMIFIGHDLAAVKNVSDRIAVMYLGRLCEVAPSEELCRRPHHPYTKALLDAVLDPRHPAGADGLHGTGSAGRRPGGMLDGEPPSPLAPPSGCRFRTRCPRAEAVCAEVEPALREAAPGHQVACHFPLTGPGP